MGRTTPTISPPGSVTQVDAGHLSMLSQPDAVTAVILDAADHDSLTTTRIGAPNKQPAN